MAQDASERICVEIATLTRHVGRGTTCRAPIVIHNQRRRRDELPSLIFRVGSAATQHTGVFTALIDRDQGLCCKDTCIVRCTKIAGVRQGRVDAGQGTSFPGTPRVCRKARYGARETAVQTGESVRQGRVDAGQGIPESRLIFQTPLYDSPPPRKCPRRTTWLRTEYLF